MVASHQPLLPTILMVEKAILESKEYPTKKKLWLSLPRKVEYRTFQKVMDYLEASGKIAYNGKAILYTGVDNDKLRKLIDSSA